MGRNYEIRMKNAKWKTENFRANATNPRGMGELGRG
jgi:hypothetical protein